MNALKTVTVLAIFVLAPLTQAAEVVITHYESLQRMSVQSAPKGAEVSSAQSASSMALSFEALGRRFDLRLEANDRLLQGMPAEAIDEAVRAYRGHLANNPDSWVRVVMYEGMPRGLVWDGTTMYAIEVPGDSALDIKAPIVYRLDDLYIAPGTMSCETKSMSGKASNVYNQMKSDLERGVSQAPGAVSEVTMGVIGDSLFTNLRGGTTAAAAAITARFNNIDGYFSEQVGVQINVQNITTFDDTNDPFSSTLSTSTLLDEVSEYRLQTSAQNSLGLTHLYTGRDFDTQTVGIAWLGAICETYFGAGVSEGRAGLTTDSLIAAHEIGHNFGADHDGDPARSCPNEPEIYIMAPSVTGNDEFSACSIDVMQATAAAASCVAPLPAVDVEISQDGQVSTVLLSASTDIEYEVSSNGTISVSGVVADFTLPSALALDGVTTSTGNCTSGAGTVNCTLGDLAGLSSHTITLSTTPVAVGVGTVNASVTTTDTDERLSNNQDALQVTVDPAVDLVVNTPSTAPVFVDSSTTVTATLENRSTMAASNVSLSVTLAAGLQADTASWSIGTCNVAAQQIDCSAGSFDAQSTSTFSLTATALTEGSQNITASLSSADADADPSNDSATATVNVVVPNDGGDDGGGGGTTGPLFLVAMLLSGWLRRRYSRSFIR